ncbi:MAG TPA: cupin domain-containing protein [Opitutaceae bacterium]|nr:cupin domain-containing protein [Opitutaceae bacterium]
MTAKDVIQRLELQPLPEEGGYFRSTWVGPVGSFRTIDGQTEARAQGSAIYALFTEQHFSALHRLATDELWHFYAGDPLELLLLHADGRIQPIALGSELLHGQRPQVLVPAGVWQGARPRSFTTQTHSHGWTLVGCTLSPSFKWEEFELGDREKLVAQYPSAREAILALTRSVS